MSALAAAGAALTDQLAGLLSRIFAGCRGAVEISGRSLLGLATSGVRIELDGTPAPVRRLPRDLLALLADGGWGLEVGLASRDPACPCGLRDLGALAVAWPVERVFVAGELRLDDARRDAVWDQLRTFPLRATAVIDGATRVVAVWALNEPLHLPEASARAEALLAELAAALGAEALTPASVVPLPGGIVRDVGNKTEPPRVELVHLSDDRFTVEQVEAALAKSAALRKGRKS